MGEKTEISWCDHTFNPWMGCTKVSPACDGCYAEAMMDLRYGKVKWGGERVRTAPSNWKQPIKWNKEAGIAGIRPRVFCASLADVFDNQVPPEWREDLFELIRITPNLVWLLLTKRPQNIVKMVHASGAVSGNGTRYLPRNAALGTTIEDQTRANINVPALFDAQYQCGPVFTFVSCEPLLSQIYLTKWLHDSDCDIIDHGVAGICTCSQPREVSISWVIAGGETDQGQHKARPSHPEWFRSLRDQCAAAGTAFHFKQWGEWAPCDAINVSRQHALCGALAAPPAIERDWSRALTFFQKSKGVTGAGVLGRVGKSKSGRLLDGIEHNGFPDRAVSA